LITLITTPKVSLVDSRTDQVVAAWLHHVYAFYLHDLSEFDPNGYVLSPSGLWQPDYLPYWLERPHCHPLVILSEGTPCGFAFIGEAPFPYMSLGVQFRLAEFFILRARRGTGLGSIAVRALLARFRGSFELTVLAGNAPALAFWRRILSELVPASLNECSSAGEVRFTFRSEI
jgi:predicted acetyltransferase